MLCVWKKYAFCQPWEILRVAETQVEIHQSPQGRRKPLPLKETTPKARVLWLSTQPRPLNVALCSKFCVVRSKNPASQSGPWAWIQCDFYLRFDHLIYISIMYPRTCRICIFLIPLRMSNYLWWFANDRKMLPPVGRITHYSWHLLALLGISDRLPSPLAAHLAAACETTQQSCKYLWMSLNLHCALQDPNSLEDGLLVKDEWVLLTLLLCLGHSDERLYLLHAKRWELKRRAEASVMFRAPSAQSGGTAAAGLMLNNMVTSSRSSCDRFKVHFFVLLLKWLLYSKCRTTTLHQTPFFFVCVSA